METLAKASPLNSGTTTPLIGFGTIVLPQNKEHIKTIIAVTLKVGYWYFDTVSIYHLELVLGEALYEAFPSQVVKRDELEYLDLYLIHWPINMKKGTSHPIPKKEDYFPLDIKFIWQGME
eukprot:Gb_41779 [translate_table: standard]